MADNRRSRGGMSTPVQMMRLEMNYTSAIFINMYGMSEGAPLTMVHPDDDVMTRAQTVGRVVEGIELRISDSRALRADTLTRIRCITIEDELAYGLQRIGFFNERSFYKRE